MIWPYTTEGYKGFVCHCCERLCESKDNLTDTHHICKCGAVYTKNHPASPVWFLTKRPSEDHCK